MHLTDGQSAGDSVSSKTENKLKTRRSMTGKGLIGRITGFDLNDRPERTENTARRHGDIRLECFTVSSILKHRFPYIFPSVFHGPE